MDLEKERKSIMNLYGALGVGLVLSLVPHGIAAVVSMVFILGVLIAAYSTRKKSEEKSLADNHTTYIIRTIWIASLFAAITLIPAIGYMLSEVDNGPLYSCLDQGLTGAADIQALETMFQPCMDEFMRVNSKVFLISLLITAGPVLLYLVVRYARGLSRAMKGYRVANVKSWF